MLEFGEINEFVTEAAKSLKEDREDLSTLVDGFATHFATRYRKKARADKVSDLFDLCHKADKDRRFRVRNEDDAEAVFAKRREMLEKLVRAFYDKEEEAERQRIRREGGNVRSRIS